MAAGKHTSQAIWIERRPSVAVERSHVFFDNTRGDERWVMDMDEAERFAHDVINKIMAYRLERANSVRAMPKKRSKGGGNPGHEG